MHESHVSTLARFSTLILLTATSACLSESSATGPKPGSGGSGTGGANDGSGGNAGAGGSSTASGGNTSRTSASGGSGGAPVTGGSAGAGGNSAGGGGSTSGTSASGGSGGTSTRGGRTGSGGVTPGTGGSAGAGGTTDSGGGAGASTRSGGRTGAGGSTEGGGGGSAGGGGGSAGGGGTSRGTGGTTSVSSSFTVKVELSTAIPTVGIATWTLGDPIDSATIELGRDQSKLELQAPVDLTADNHRTLLLGMKQNATYYVRVTASGGGQSYVSQVASIKTGTLPAGLPVVTVTDQNASGLYARGGFTVSCMGWATTSSGSRDAGASGSWAFIIDPDGDMVWAYDLSKTVAPQCTRARMSLDGKYMWANNFGNTTPDGALARISMDGLGTPGAYSLPGSNHDFAILPDDHVVYIVRDSGGSGMQPESLFELDPATSQTKLIYRETTDFGDLFDTRGGHTNQVNYVPDLKAISFSMYFINTIGLVSYPEGKLLAAFGGDNSTFSTMSWTGQHGHDIYQDHMVLFNNEGTNGAKTIRFKYDLQAKTATEQASYSSGLSTRALGDVKELPNGNYFVTYSMMGTMHEIDPSMKLLREIEAAGASIGYAEHRASLYGPPPPYDR